MNKLFLIEKIIRVFAILQAWAFCAVLFACVLIVLVNSIGFEVKSVNFLGGVLMALAAYFTFTTLTVGVLGPVVKDAKNNLLSYPQIAIALTAIISLLVILLYLPAHHFHFIGKVLNSKITVLIFFLAFPILLTLSHTFHYFNNRTKGVASIDEVPPYYKPFYWPYLVFAVVVLMASFLI